LLRAAIPGIQRGGHTARPGLSIIATEATQRLGEIAVCGLVEEISVCRDAVTTGGAEGEYQYSVEDTVAAFQTVRGVQYGETVRVGDHLEVVGYSSGRLLGGAWFSLDFSGGTGQRVQYVVDYNLATSKYLKGMNTTQLGLMKTGGLMITDAGREEVGNGGNQLQQTIANVLRKEGSVLLPVDTVGGVLELLIFMEEWWQEESNMRNFPIAFVSCTGDVLIDQVRCRLEWMNDRVINKFNSSNNFSYNPFVFEFINFFPDHHSFMDVFPTRPVVPKIVIASGASLEFGEARELFFKLFISEPNNAVIFTEHVSSLPPDSLAAKLLDGRIVAGSSFVVPQGLRVPLNDEQLRDFYRRKLEDERIEDELRRRRFRERERARLGLLAAEAGEVGPGGMVDLIGAGRGGWFENEIGNGEDGISGFFRPRLFNALTRVNPLAGTSEAVRMPGNVSEYGTAIGRNDVDTWRAHANAGNLKGVGTVDEEETGGVEGGVKKQQVKSAAKNETSETSVKDEKKANLLGTIDGSMGFDWRRDLAVRFGEPMRTELRERQGKLSCKIHKISGPIGSGFSTQLMRKEIFSLAQNCTVAILPSSAENHEQLVENARFGFARHKIFDLKEGPVRVGIKGKRKLALLDIDHLAMASVGQHAVGVIPKPVIKQLGVSGEEDEIVTPLGERIEVAVTSGTSEDSSTAGIFLADHKISLAEIKRWLTDAGIDADFHGPAADRCIDVLDGKLRVQVTTEGLIDVSGDHELLAALRSLLYKKLRVV
jgi:Cft2 family RNA processing exonuclease